MVAGILMSLRELRNIYELLFRDGVIVAKDDRRPQSQHPEVQGVTNLQVIQALRSLKSRGYVRESYVWRHHYWYLTDEGIHFLRQYLHLPTDIVPGSLRRVSKTTARGRAPVAQSGPIPRPEGHTDRQQYRRIQKLSVDKLTGVELGSKPTPKPG
ncbi:40S ribosomal protein S10-like [Chiloscyllium plagiosum]|uniref:40S ribosomal protein S10-like n=1 Tax=Chiloscyllium plagiosum TaxID=36176 RepID=UPI001CB86D5F|nr:40S ribosomal protein S10-like [Chiloscyllium plagiosum]